MQKTLNISVLLFLLVVPAKGESPYSNLVAGVSKVFDQGGPAPVLPLDASWKYIVSGAKTASPPSNFVMARGYGAGRVFVAGHEAIFGDTSANMFDNTRFMANVLNWLD